MVRYRTLIFVLILLVVVLFGLFFINGLLDENREIVEAIFGSEFVNGTENNNENTGGLFDGFNIFGSGSQIVFAQNSSGENIIPTSSNPVWSDDSKTLAFSTSGGLIYGTNVNGSDFWQITGDDLDKYGRTRGAIPKNDPKSSDLLYIANIESDHYGSYTHIISKISFDGQTIDDYVRFVADQKVYGFMISPDGSKIISAGLLFNVTSDDKVLKGKAIELSGWCLEFSYDSEYIICINGNSVYQYEIATGAQDEIMSINCTYGDYCASENKIACFGNNDSDLSCNPLVIYDLNSKEKSDLICETNIITASHPSWSPDCSKIAYRAYDHLNGAMIKIVEVS
ncbi:MAG: hypothetical protein V1672_04185 [Candidatus Diapherotrites archaeon]